jgi:hypothetical protein
MTALYLPPMTARLPLRQPSLPRRRDDKDRAEFPQSLPIHTAAIKLSLPAKLETQT